MDHLLITIGGAIGVFAGTNVDDLLFLTVLFLQRRASGQKTLWPIWAGQYLGLSLLIGASGVAALGLTVLPDRWVGWLGLLPIALGVWGPLKAVRHRGTHAGTGPVPGAANGLLSVAGITIANGADNIAVYTPIFRTMSAVDLVVLLTVFAVLVAVWCAAASWLGSHRRVVALTERYGHWIVPGVFIVIGVVIIAESGVVGRLF